jgi:hypothetical protein
MLPGFHTNAYFSLECYWKGEGDTETQFVSILGDRAKRGGLGNILKREGIKIEACNLKSSCVYQQYVKE